MTNDQIAQYCTPESTELISREGILNCIMDALTVKERQQKCRCGERTGWTAIKCCNICGYPMPTEPWKFTDTPNVEVSGSESAAPTVRGE
jgi:hypothetical protein